MKAARFTLVAAVLVHYVGVVPAAEKESKEIKADRDALKGTWEVVKGVAFGIPQEPWPPGWTYTFDAERVTKRQPGLGYEVTYRYRLMPGSGGESDAKDVRVRRIELNAYWEDVAVSAKPEEDKTGIWQSQKGIYEVDEDELRIAIHREYPKDFTGQVKSSSVMILKKAKDTD